MADYIIVAKAAPVVPVVRYAAFGCVYLADQRRGVLTPKAISNCVIVRVKESDHGSLIVVLELDRPITREEGRPIEISYGATVNSNIPAVSILREFTKGFRGRTAFRIQFTPPMIPKEVWWFRHDDLVKTSNDPNVDQLLAVNQYAFYHREFLDIENEFVGLSWTW